MDYELWIMNSLRQSFIIRRFVTERPNKPH
jgi:hypothetical protein